MLCKIVLGPKTALSPDKPYPEAQHLGGALGETSL